MGIEPWENRGKSVGKPWENHGEMVIYIENDHRNSGLMWIFPLNIVIFHSFLFTRPGNIWTTENHGNIGLCIVYVDMNWKIEYILGFMYSLCIVSSKLNYWDLKKVFRRWEGHRLSFRTFHGQRTSGREVPNARSWQCLSLGTKYCKMQDCWRPTSIGEKSWQPPFYNVRPPSYKLVYKPQ